MNETNQRSHSVMSPTFSPKLINVYRKMRSKTLDILSQDELNEIAQVILTKPPEARNTTDIKLLVECTKNVKFFMDLVAGNGKETHEKCCRYMSYEYFDANDIVFDLGSEGFKFYIILKGSVGVLVNIPKTVEEINEKGEKIQRVELVLTDVKTLSSGASFGELALLDNRARAATIKCKEITQFAILEKNAFNQILKEKEKKKLDNEIDFLRSLEVLSNWSYTDAKYLFYHTIKKTFPIKTCMYKVGDEANNFYIIRSGEFQIDIAVTLPVEGTLLFKQQSEKFSSKYNISSKNRSITKYLKFAILSKNEYFGFEELLDNKKRNHRVTCISELGEVSIIYKKEFLRRIVSDQKTKNHLIKMSEKHEEMKQARINEFLNLERKYGILKKPSILDQYSEFQQNNINKTFNTPTPQSKLMLSQTFPDNDRNLSLIFKSLEKSTLSKLESTKNPNLNLRTEASEIKDEKNIDLFSFSKKHNSTMNLHHKLKSLENNLKKIVEISHITSKLDIMKDLRCSFKPQEMVKLKAFQEMDQKHKDFDVYRDFRGKIKIEDDKRFFISKIILREIKEKIQISKKIAIINMKIEKADERRRLNLDKTENLSKKGEKILQNLRETRRTSQKSKSEYSRKHLKMSSLTLLNKDLLPLKYNTEKYERKTIKLPVLKLLQK